MKPIELYSFQVNNPLLLGIFPQSYVQRLPDETTWLPIVKEISASLREWNHFFKEKFLSDPKSPTVINALMREVMSFRSHLMSGNLTVEESKEIQVKCNVLHQF